MSLSQLWTMCDMETIELKGGESASRLQERNNNQKLLLVQTSNECGDDRQESQKDR